MWGFLRDKLGFKILMIIITLIEIIISITIQFSVHNSFLYAISILAIAACIGGHFAILAPTFNKVFGLGLGPELYGITGIFIGIASISGPLLTNFILKDEKDESNQSDKNNTTYKNKKDEIEIEYLIVFLVSTILCSIKLIFTVFFDENTPYAYKSELNKLLPEYKDDKSKEDPQPIIREEEEE